MHSFLSLCQSRRSVHHFLPGHTLPLETYRQALEMMRLSPSGYNAQPWASVLVQRPEKLKQLQAAAFGQKHIQAAGNAVVLLGETSFATRAHDIAHVWQQYGGYTDTQAERIVQSLKKTRSDAQWREMTLRSGAMAAMTFLYALESLGWNTCPMMGFDQRKVLELVNAPEGSMPLLLVAVGKADTSKTPPRLPRRDISTWAYQENFTRPLQP